MVLCSRPTWIRGQTPLGRGSKCSVCEYPLKTVVHVTLMPMTAERNVVANDFNLALIHSLIASIDGYSVMDRGHAHTDGTCAVTIVFKHRAAAPSEEEV